MCFVPIVFIVYCLLNVCVRVLLINLSFLSSCLLKDESSTAIGQFILQNIVTLNMLGKNPMTLYITYH